MSSDKIGDGRQPADQPWKKDALTPAEAEQRLEENAGAIRSSNEYVEKHGLPLARSRQS